MDHLSAPSHTGVTNF